MDADKMSEQSVDQENQAQENQAREYQARVRAEREFFSDCQEVHDLPPIFNYWSNKWLLPKLQAMDLTGPQNLFEKALLKQCERHTGAALRFVSIGAGNCDTEVALARYLRENGHSNFVLDCLELNPAMLERGREMAARQDLAQQLRFVECDFNQWRAIGQYHAVMANQSLHHVSNLEGLFDQVRTCLAPGGQFAISDMIGRNGHMRWPEALEIVQEFWRELPDAYRYNVLLKRQEELYDNWDCSTEGFEGIRAQDILPLLIDRFHFELFLPFANVIAPFVDRAFGPNFKADAAWDRDFIDRVHLRDETEMRAGRVKPTQMLALLSTNEQSAGRYFPPLTPESCVRLPGKVTQNQADESWLRQQILELDRQAKQYEQQARAEALEREGAEWKLRMAAQSKWVRLGRLLGWGPRLP